MADLSTGSGFPTSISASQSQKEVTANQQFQAVSPANKFGKKEATSAGLTFGYYGGKILVDGVLTTVNDGTVALTNGATNFIEVDRTGAVSVNTTAFSAGRLPLYQITASGSIITAQLDYRQSWRKGMRLVKAMPTDGDYTLSGPESWNDILEFAGGSTLTATRNIVLPAAVQQWTVFNNTTGAQSLIFKTPAGTGVTVANAKRAQIYADGTNVVRVTADT